MRYMQDTSANNPSVEQQSGRHYYGERTPSCVVSHSRQAPLEPFSGRTPSGHNARHAPENLISLGPTPSDTREIRLCFLDLRFFVVLGKSYLTSVAVHVSALNKDHTYSIKNNWAEGKDLYESEEKKVIGKMLTDVRCYNLGTLSLIC